MREHEIQQQKREENARFNQPFLARTPSKSESEKIYREKCVQFPSD